MALIVKNRVRETSSTTGTGAIALLGAVSDHRTFASVMTTNDTAWVTIVHPGTGEWETSRATYTGTNQLTRSTVLDGSNGTSAVNFTAGVKDVFIDLPASMLGSTEAQLDASITTAKIADANVTNGKLAATAVSQDKVDSTVWNTGNARLTLQTTASTGWLMMDDATFGDGSSAATHTGSQYQALFLLLFANLADADAPILTSAGAGTTRVGQGTAAAAWAAHCRMTLPKQLGRALVIAGAGSGLTSRTLGSTVGEETHLLTTPEIPSHTHVFTGSPLAAHSHTPSGGSAFYTSRTTGAQVGSTGLALGSDTNTSSDSAGTPSGTNANAGGGGAHNNMQPSAFWNMEIKY